MADKTNKYEDNKSGAYYVDTQCIDCDLCRQTAPENFDRNSTGGYSFVKKQPENAEEVSLCKEALEGCPVEAIGSDGAGEGAPAQKTSVSNESPSQPTSSKQ